MTCLDFAEREKIQGNNFLNVPNLSFKREQSESCFDSAERVINQKQNVPNLRFPEFTEEWKTVLIGDVLKIGNGKDYKLLKIGNIPVFGTGGYMLSVNDYLYDGESVFIGRKGTINKPFYFSGKFWTVDTLFYTHSFIDVLPKFVYGLFQNINWNLYNEASGVPSLSKSTIEKIKCKIPSTAEQQKITKLLFLLDERIATQNKIIEDLKKLKVAITNQLIDNLISTESLSYFSEVYSKAGEGGTPETSKCEYYESGVIPFIKIDDLTNKYIDSNKDYITELGLKKSSAWLIPPYSLIYSNGATIGAISINKYEVATKQGILGIVPKTNISVEYLYCLMSSTYFTKQVNRIITHGTMPTAYLKDINKVKVPIPYKQQQIEIANIVSSVSNKIETELNILSLLNSQKQYLLQQMFI